MRGFARSRYPTRRVRFIQSASSITEQWSPTHMGEAKLSLTGPNRPTNLYLSLKQQRPGFDSLETWADSRHRAVFLRP